MSKSYFITLVLLILAAGLSARADNHPIAGDSASTLKLHTDTAAAAMDFTMMDFNDKSLTLSSFRGKSYVILDFWASWCGPCRQFTYNLKAIYNQYHSKGLEVVSVSSDNSLSEWVTGVLTDGMNKWYNIYPSAHKNYKNFNRDWGVKGVPTVILLDKQGKIIERYTGTDYKGNIPELRQKLAELLK